MSKKLLLLTLVALFATTYAQDIGDGNGNGIGDTVNGVPVKVPSIPDKVEAGLADAAVTGAMGAMWSVAIAAPLVLWV
jgi:hypothetical protein